MTYSGSASMVDTKIFGHVRPPRVLLVEDNTLVALDLEDILRGYGCQVIGPSATVRDALEALEREEIDIAVVDYLLEDGEAAPLARSLDVKGIPFAICTGAGVAELSSLYPNTPILAKPYNPDDVSIVVNSLIASRLAAS
ncbi:response regulator [Hyphomicrobium sp.]|uniref:response regulator n=1 Tax=Hyphomicrobium sp. TaxID=82 RepID=UPI001DEE88DE|nr:response regulator [Hyphomicrobium sp.]MBY0558667.1 response regulator [Hyphomicrobium sp.]